MEAWGGSVSLWIPVWALLAITALGIVGTWVVALSWSQGRRTTTWVTFAGVILSLAPWLGLAPAWGYWLIALTFWASLIAARVLRYQVFSAGTRRSVPEEAAPPDDAQGIPTTSEPPPASVPFYPSFPDEAPPQEVRDAALILGVSVSDSPEKIRAAYIRWAKTLHPDRNPSPVDSSEQLKRINNAKEILLEYSRDR
jgi:hypothetical protein